MATQPPSFPLDPAGMLRELVSQWEKGLNEVANRAMASDEFNRGMHGGLGASLTAQKSLNELLGRTVSSLNLPTRGEVAALGDRLQSIEERLIRMESLLDRAVGAAAGDRDGLAPPRPRRTRQPPAPQAAVEPPPSSSPKPRRNRTGQP